jgi:hypothetical protein
MEVVVRSISTPTFELFDKTAQLAAGTAPRGWSLQDGLLLFKGKVFVLDASALWPTLLVEAHDVGHEGTEKSLHCWRSSFYNPLANHRVREFVKGCAVC